MAINHMYLTSLFSHSHKEEANIQGVTGGRDQTSGGCSLCETIPKKPKTHIQS
jgi:hypothetical protein